MPAADPAHAPPRGGPLSILVVDDQEDTRTLLRLLLDEAGYAALTAATPAHGLALLRGGGIALILTDSFSTTPRDLFGPTAGLRQAADPIPVALLTAYRVAEADAQAVGFVGVVAKPFDLDDLLARIQRWMHTGSPTAPGRA